MQTSVPPSATDGRASRAALLLPVGACCAALGLLVIVGWHAGLSGIVHLRMQYRPMPYGSAAGFFLIGLAFAATALGRFVAARFLVGALLIVLLMSNSAALGGPDLSFEYLLKLPSLGGRPEFFGRMPPNALLNFTLAAAAVVGLTLPRTPVSLVALCGSVIGSVGVTSVFGYVTDLTGAYSWRGLPPMSLHGAIGFIALGIACLHTAWTRTTASQQGLPQWAPVPAGIAAGTTSLVLWQALLQGNQVTLARATLFSGATVACALALSLHFALSARRQLRRAEATARELAEEVVERHRAEDAMRDSELRLRQMIDANPIGVVRVDEAGRILDANEAFLWVVGSTREELRTKRLQWSAIALPEYVRRDEQAIAEARERGRSAAYENVFLRGATRVPVLIAWASLGSSRELTAFVLDIADRKQAEDALRDADRRKDEFLATLAHELRNPLAPIRFAMRLLASKDAPPEQAERSRDVIERQLNQMIRLVDDLLDVSRITRNKIQLRKQRVSLRAVIATAIEAADPHVKAANHRLMVDIDGEDPELEADPARLVQVFTNLLNNAVKFTRPGGEIAFSLETVDGRAVAKVRDSGVGIPAETLPHIFDMFHQADHGLDRSVGGLGIGLAIAKRIVEMHGGTLSVASDGHDRGSEFLVELPTLPRRVEEPPSQQTSRDAVAPSRALRVLVVDDNVDSADMLSFVVSAEGHEARAVYDGRAALDAFDEFNPGVVLLDIGLPKLNGYDVAREIRRRSGARCYLVAITGWGQPEDRRRAREAGFDCHMTKPADPDMITRLLAAVAAGVDCHACSPCIQTPLTRVDDFKKTDAPERALNG